MAEDFYSIFKIGENNKGLSSVDMAGVALAAINAAKQQDDEFKSELIELKVLVSQLIERRQ